MNMVQIMKILEFVSSKELYTVTCKMLDDYYNNTMRLPESIERIEKTKSICDTISNSVLKTKNISGSQAYALRAFVANSLGAYGNITDEKDVREVFRSLIH